MLLIATLAVLQAHPLFLGEYTWNLASIEGAYIAQSRLLRENFPVPGWNPLWYGGHPFKLSYSPGFLYVVNAFSILLNVGIGEAYRRVAAFSLILLPLALYVLAWRLSGSHVPAFLTSLLYVALPSAHRAVYAYPSVPPCPDQVTVTALYGETPHVLGLALAFLTAALFYHYTVKGKRVYAVLLPLAVCFVNLINLIAAVSLAVLMVGIAALRGWDAVKRLSLVYLLAIGLGTFAYDPEYIQAAIIHGQMTGGTPPLTIPTVVVILAVLAASYAASRYVYSKTSSFFTAAALLLSSSFLLVALFNRFAGIGLLPQAVRYGPEFDAFLYGLVGSSLSVLFMRLRRGLAVTLAVILSVLMLASFMNGLAYSQAVLRPGDVERSIEKQVADELATLLSDRFGPRAYATGSIAFWLNVFTDVPQVRGGYDEVAGSFSPLWSHVSYLINTNRNSSLILLWLKAYNVKYVVVDMPWAALPYKDYLYPEKFEEILKSVKEVGGVRVYEVPLSCPEPVQLVKTEAHVPVIGNIFDVKNLHSYLKLVDGCYGEASLQYAVENNNRIKVRVYNLDGEHSLLFKTNYDDGWVAYVNGKKLPSKVVGPNFVLFEMNGVRGDAEVEIGYSSRPIDLLYDAFSAVVLVAMLVYCIRGVKFYGIGRKGSSRA